MSFSKHMAKKTGHIDTDTASLPAHHRRKVRSVPPSSRVPFAAAFVAVAFCARWPFNGVKGREINIGSTVEVPGVASFPMCICFLVVVVGGGTILVWRASCTSAVLFNIAWCVQCVQETARPYSPSIIMGGGNAQKSAKARADKLAKAGKAGGGSQIKQQKNALNIKCFICFNSFMCTTYVDWLWSCTHVAAAVPLGACSRRPAALHGTVRLTMSTARHAGADRGQARGASTAAPPLTRTRSRTPAVLWLSVRRKLPELKQHCENKHPKKVRKHARVGWGEKTRVGGGGGGGGAGAGV